MENTILKVLNVLAAAFAAISLLHLVLPSQMAWVISQKMITYPVYLLSLPILLVRVCKDIAYPPTVEFSKKWKYFFFGYMWTSMVLAGYHTMSAYVWR